MKAIGINDFLDRKFKHYELDGQLQLCIGNPETNFKMLVYGDPKNGKTEFCIQLAKLFAPFRKVYYNSFEQGIGKTLQDAVKRNNMQEVSGRVMFGNKESFEQMDKRLSGKGSPGIVFIDSRDYMNLTDQQFKQLIEKHRRKAFILICWANGDKMKGEHAKNIAYMCDITVFVKNFKAHPVSRFGGNQTYTIWDRKPQVGEQSNLFNS